MEAARTGVRWLLAFYASTPSYRPVLEVEGWADIQPELNALSKQGRFAEMRALITDPMVAQIGIVGTPEQCAQQLVTRFGDHVDEVCCYFPGYTPPGADIADLIGVLHRSPARR